MANLQDDDVVTHDTLIGQVMFMVPANHLSKSHVSSHYRHGKNGKLIFVHGYDNHVFAKPEELTSDAFHKQNLEPMGQAVQNPEQEKVTSFHVGDQVFISYSHLHDQHFLTGVVVGTRSDAHHNGKLVLVKEKTGIVEAYAPKSLQHLFKEYNEFRQHETSPHKDEKGNYLKYKHLNPEQLANFHDLHKLWYKLHRMAEALTFQNNPQFHFNAETQLPVNGKMDLTAEQKIELEKLNPISQVPFEAILSQVGDDEYSPQNHYNAIKHLLSQIDEMKAQGAPVIEFPKLKVSKSKKEQTPVPADWYMGQFPSETEEVESLSGKSKEDIYVELSKLKFEVEKATGMKGTPADYKPKYTTDVDYAQGLPEEAWQHGAVVEPTKEFTYPEPTKPSASQEQVKEAVQSILGPTPVIPKEKFQEAPQFAPKPTLVVPSDQEVDISDLAENAKVVGNAKKFGFSGTHTKYILDANGQQLLFKPYLNEEQHRTWADIVAANVMKLVGLDTAPVGSKPVTKHIPSIAGGNYANTKATGSVQSIIPNLKKNNIQSYVDSNFTNAPQEHIERLQKEHVIDWLLGNNDAHAAQFVIDKDNNLIGIDKGQAFKFYKQDVLSMDYDPNYNIHAAHPQIYNVLLKSAKTGKIKLNWGVVQDFIENDLGNLSSLKWGNLVKNYASSSAVWSGEPHKLQNLATKRLGSVLKDFKKLYESAGVATEYDKKKGAWKQPSIFEEEKLPSSATYQSGAFQNIDAHFHAKVTQAKMQGHSILMGGGDFEDMSTRFTPYNWKGAGKTGKHGIMMEGTVLKGAEPKFIGYFDTVVDQEVEWQMKSGLLPSDPFGDKLKYAAMTINHHAPNGGKQADGAYNQDKITPFAKVFQGLDAFDANAPILSVQDIAKNIIKDNIVNKDDFKDYITLATEVAQYYHDAAEEIVQAAKGGNKTPKHYENWSGDYTTKKAEVSQKNHPWATYPKFVHDPETGEMVRTTGEKNAVYQGKSSFGVLFKKSLPGNIEIRYYPHYNKSLTGQNNYYSQQGRLIVDMHDWDGKEEGLHKIRQILQDMGLDNKLSDHNDIECLYLARAAWQQKADVVKPKEWKKIQAMPNSPEKIDALKKLCKEIYPSGKSPDELPTYDPKPNWDSSSGRHYFTNPYVLQHIQTEGAQIPVLFHNISNPSQNAESIVRYGLLSTEERHRIGLNPTTSSPVQDQESGGANYVFLNMNYAKKGDEYIKAGESGRLVFKPELMARSDLIGFPSDHYGCTHEGHYGHWPSITTRIPIMDMVTGKQKAHEVIVKHRIPLEKWFLGMYGKGYGESTNLIKEYIKKHKPHLMSQVKFL